MNVFRPHRRLAAALAVAPLSLTPGFNSINPARSAWVHEDATGKQGCNDVASAAARDSFTPFAGGVDPNFGISSSAFWMRFTLKNAADLQRSLLLEVGYPLLDELDLCYFDDGAVVKQQGDHRPKENRERKFRTFVFSVPFLPGQERDVYLRVATMGSLKVPLMVWEEKAFDAHIIQDTGMYCLYYGAVLAISIFNLLLFVSTREVNYLIYVLFQLSFLGIIAGLAGHGYLWLWSSSAYVTNLAVLVFGPVANTFGLLFSRRFLNLATVAPGWDKGLRALMWVAAAQSIVTLFAYDLQGPLSIAVYLLACAVAIPLLCAGFVALFRGVKEARFFCLAWSQLLAAVVYFNLENMQVVGTSVGTIAFDLSLICEALLLSLGLGFQFNEARRQKFLYAKRLQVEELKKQEAELMAEAQRKETELTAKEAEKQRTLVRVISHDLANPLGVILNWVRLGLADPTANEKQRKTLDRIQGAARHQMNVIEHVRELIALESGKLTLRLAPVNLRDCLDQARLMFEEKLQEKSLKLVIEGDMENLSVVAEPISFQNNVINNLISNAIKFSNDGDTITVRATGEGARVLIEIIDQGIGISATLLAQLFDGSKPTSRRGTRGERGTGFGMPIVKSYVEAYGGEVSVTSRPVEESPDAHGSVFAVRLRHAPQQRLKKAS